MVQVKLHRIFIVAHVAVIDVIQQADGGVFALEKLRTKLQLDILGARSRDIGIEIRAICDLGHQRFGKAQSPVALFQLDHRSDGVAARVSRIVVGAVVVDHPVQELVVAVGSANIVVEEVRERELSEPEVETFDGNLGRHGQRRAV